MVKGIINAFDHMEFCLVINLTMCGNLAVTWLPMLATRFCYYLKYQVASTCYPQKKLISNTVGSLACYPVHYRRFFIRTEKSTKHEWVMFHLPGFIISQRFSAHMDKSTKGGVSMTDIKHINFVIKLSCII